LNYTKLPQFGPGALPPPPWQMGLGDWLDSTLICSTLETFVDALYKHMLLTYLCWWSFA